MGSILMLKQMTIAASLSIILFLPATPAFGCEGKRILFEDNFTDASGGWFTDSRVRIANSSFIIKAPVDGAYTTLNAGYPVKGDADICVEVGWPQNEISNASAGVAFWAEDYTNYFLFLIRGAGSFGVFRKSNGKWFTISSSTPVAAVKAAVNATNVLRVRVKGDLASLFVNNAQMRDLRGSAPQAGWLFGMLVESNDKENEIEIPFKRFKVTDTQ